MADSPEGTLASLGGILILGQAWDDGGHCTAVSTKVRDDCRHRQEVPGATLVGDDTGTVGCVLNASTGSTIMAAGVVMVQLVVRYLSEGEDDGRGGDDVVEEEEKQPGSVGQATVKRGAWFGSQLPARELDPPCPPPSHSAILVGVAGARFRLAARHALRLAESTAMARTTGRSTLRSHHSGG